MRTPQIALVMPSLNQGKYLTEAIESVLAQRYPNLNFAILDGGSSDDSPQIIERYSRHLTYWHSRPDGGQTDALITGFELLQGELLGWLNSDDVLLPGALHAVAAAYERRPTAGLISGNFIWIYADGRIFRCKRHPANPAFWAARGLVPVVQPGSFFSRDAYNQVGGLERRLEYVMDTDLYLRLLRSGRPYVHVNRWLSAFRLNGERKGGLDRTMRAEELRAVLAERRRAGISVSHSRFDVWLYRGWQVINGNYPRMAADTASAKGKDWHQWVSEMGDW